MNDLFTSTQTIVISCSPHIVPYLKMETESAGFPIEDESWTTIQIAGTFNDAIRLNLTLRTANHVFLLIKKFVAESILKLYEEIKSLPWEEVLFEDGYFTVHSVSEHAEVLNSMFLNMKVKDAIADHFSEQFGKRPNSGAEKNRAVIFLHWKDNECSLYLDTSGETLTKHGYRLVPSKAPLQESLAAALIMATRWNLESPFINPMCGSGTLAIEAALMAINKPPGLIRNNYGFMHLKGFNQDDFQKVKGELSKNVLSRSLSKIIATDVDRKSVRTAKENAKTAGVEHLIEFITCDFEETPVPPAKGILIVNPPYGERLGASQDLKKTYAELGNFLKHKCPGYFGYIFTANPDLAKSIGLKPSSKKIFLNGSLECRLLGYEMFEGRHKDFKIAGSI